MKITRRRNIATEPPTQVFGDSLTYFGLPWLATDRPAWAIDGVRGREAKYLPGLMEEYKLTYGSYPQRLVIALGTNEIGATREMYEGEIAKMGSRPVVLVTCYRDPDVFGQERADKMAEISGWFVDIKNNRPNTALAPWRSKVLNNPDLLYDGVHATTAGEQAWSNCVQEAMDRVG